MGDNNSTESSQTGEREHNRAERPREPDNEPPYSRVFVVCGKAATEEELEPEFKAHGPLQYCRIIREKGSQESKGYAYVKYEKASSAALAIEALNGKVLGEDHPPLKVLIAEAKGTTAPKFQSREPEDTPPRSRLFVVCSKDFTEEELTEKFKIYGDLEYCKLVKDRTTHESKGYAYVKYSKASHASLAIEEVGKTVEEGVKLKALVADPKGKNKPEAPSPPALPLGYSSMPMVRKQALPYTGYDLAAYGIPPYPLPRQRLFIVCHKTVTQDQLARLFSRYPGMEYCDLKKQKQTGESKGFAYINYSTPQAALMAKDQMDGFEFPPGSFLKVLFAEPLGMKSSASTHAQGEATVSGIGDRFAQMMSNYPSIGYAPLPAPMSPSGSDSKQQSTDRHFPEGSRLFIVLAKPLPDYVLQDVFSRYGALEYVHLVKEKSFGYAKYTTAMSAQYAMQSLNGTDIQGQKIKIQVANAPPNSDQSRNTKRQKI